MYENTMHVMHYEFTYCILSFISVLPVTVDKIILYLFINQEGPLRIQYIFYQGVQGWFPDNHWS